jgi:phosphatidylglycerol:prolipoprotein diacylglycerol transferase
MDAMYPILYQVGPFEIRSYGVMLAISFVAGTWLARHRARRAGMDTTLKMDVYLFIVIASLVGSRVQFMLENLVTYSSAPSRALRTWEGGLSMQSGVILAILAVFFYVRAKGESFARAADVLAPSVALGACLTRIGCFLNGCCFGGVCSLPWAMAFPRTSEAGMQFPGIAIHPTQLYLSLSGLAIFVTLLAVEKRSSGYGRIFGLFLILDSTARFAVDFIRYYDPSSTVFTISSVAISHYQIISAGLFVAGWYFLWRSGRFGRWGAGDAGLRVSGMKIGRTTTA